MIEVDAPVLLSGSATHPDRQARWMRGDVALVELALDWAALEHYAAGPTQHYDWACAAAAVFAGQGTLRVATVWQQDRLVAAAPFVLQRRGPTSEIRLVGLSELREPMDLLYEDPAALEHLAARLVAVGYPLRLERLSAASPTIAALRRACRGRASMWVRPQPSCPYIRLDSSWRDPLAHLNAGRRSDWRRARRRAEASGPVETTILTPRPSELADVLDQALWIEANSWKGEAGSALACDHERASFYRRYAAAASRAGLLRLCFLHIGGEPAAMQLAVQTGNSFWLLKIGYDQRFARCSPGMLLMHDTIAAAAREGLATYEFLGQAEGWTELWAPQVHEQVSLHVYPWRPAGLAALAIDGGRMLWRRWKNR